MLSIILSEVKKVFITVCVLGVAIVGGTVAFSMFDSSIIYGYLFGAFYTLANFLLLGTISAKAVMMPPHKAKQYMMTHYFIRYILTGSILFIGFKTPYMNGWVVVILLLSPKITYYIIGFAQVIKDAISVRKDK